MSIGENVLIPQHGVGIVVGEEWIRNVQTVFISVI